LTLETRSFDNQIIISTILLKSKYLWSYRLPYFFPDYIDYLITFLRLTISYFLSSYFFTTSSTFFYLFTTASTISYLLIFLRSHPLLPIFLSFCDYIYYFLPFYLLATVSTISYLLSDYIDYFLSSYLLAITSITCYRHIYR
jgi:hypothetical protein